MHIAKLRTRDEQGLVPAGRYFEGLAASLREANARDAQRRERKIAPRTVEERDRSASAGRTGAATRSAERSAPF